MSVHGLHLHPADNVALALEPLSPGAIVEVANKRVEIRDFVPYGHKFAVEAIPLGAQVIKYGQPIGRTIRPVEPGSHVHTHNLASAHKVGEALETDGYGYRSNVAELILEKPLSSQAKFLGFRRCNGQVGVRNHVLVLATVHCANGVVERIGRESQAVALPHIYGCSQLGKDLAQTRRILEAYASHPNVGAALLVGLGCESMPTVEIADGLRKRGVIAEHILIQEEGGSRAAVTRGLKIVRKLLRKTMKARREPVPASELVVGVECGGSDAWSGITANPVVGVAADILVALGGTVILSEVTEFIGAEHLLLPRAASREVACQILAAMARRERMAREMGVDLRGAQPSPGNMAGGLTTIEEKSLGAILKGGTSPIKEFLSYGEQPSQNGLAIMDTSGNDLESVTAMVAGGAQLIIFTTGRGTPAGNPIAPVIKVASNSKIFSHLREDMDFDAGTVLAGESVSSLGRRLFGLVLKVASGKVTAAEKWGHKEFAIESLGPRV